MTPEDADVDRARMREAVEEMRAAVNRLRGIAKSMAANAALLARAQHATTRRIRMNKPNSR